MRTVTFFMALALAFQLTYAQYPGDLDPTFGENGIVQTIIAPGEIWEADMVRDILELSNGKILASGTARFFGMQRKSAYVMYNADGSIDTSFGNNGIILLTPEEDNFNYQNYASDAVELPDGSIISCGHIHNTAVDASRPYLVKFKDGQLDTSFGNNGIALGYLQYNLGERMVLQEDGKIVVSGYLNDNIAAVRFNADGSMDTTFGNNGYAEIIIEGAENFSFAKDIALQKDGKILLGSYYGDNGNWKWVVVRLNSDGTLDSTFGEGGLKKMSVGYGHDFVLGIAVQEDGKIIVGGHSWDANIPTLRYSLAIARLNEDGSTDTGYANNGVFRRNFLMEGCSYLTGLNIASNGKVYASMSAQENIPGVSFKYDIGIVSLNEDGTLNDAFGGQGYIITDLNEQEDHSQCMALQRDGKILHGAMSFRDDGTPFVVARYITDIPADINPTLQDKESFVVYPNPVKDVLNIAFEGDFKVQIFDMSGRLVLTSNNNRTINVNGIAAGSYIVKLTAGNKTYTDRFIKF